MELVTPTLTKIIITKNTFKTLFGYLDLCSDRRVFGLGVLNPIFTQKVGF